MLSLPRTITHTPLVERATFRGVAATTTEGADLIGRRAEVPDPRYDGPTEEYVEGEVIDVHPSDASGPVVAVVALGEERVALPLTRAVRRLN